MIKISHKEKCTGCGACVSSCPQNCISMNADGEGFKYPIINEELCCGCNLCEKVCPYLHRQEEVQPLKTYAAYHQQETYVKKSTSGGVFSILAEKIIEQGGVVFGARFDKDWQVDIDAAKTKKELGYEPQYKWRDYCVWLKRERKLQRFAKIWGTEEDYKL